MPGHVLRSFREGDDEAIVQILAEAFGSIEHLPRVRVDIARTGHSRQGLFIAEKTGAPVGCIYVVSFPRKNWYNLRYLAVVDKFSNPEISESLVQRAAEHAESVGCEYLKATTAAVQPYVDVYKRFRFSPVRRTLRLAWDLRDTFEKRKHAFEIRELSKNDEAKVGEMIVEGHLPYWDWWLEEQGGEEVTDWPARFGFPTGTWLGSIHENRITSLAGFAPDAYGEGEARLQCFCVSPKFRGQGIGSVLLSEILERAKRNGQRKLVIYTFAYLDYLPPGAVTYLKSGARIEGEYLQLKRI